MTKDVLTQAILVFCGFFMLFFAVALVVLIVIGVTPDALSVPVFMLACGVIGAMASGAAILLLYSE